ncbi:hypothetical protein C4579_02070 [Candidatus Microgenomates bacterium]|nr:MAG: hypothetical protein C4579_02070 [Candidatus Microgenomates bacterium]
MKKIYFTVAFLTLLTLLFVSGAVEARAIGGTQKSQPRRIPFRAEQITTQNQQETLGVRAETPRMNREAVMNKEAASCVTRARITWQAPTDLTIDHFNIYYGTGRGRFEHAVGNLDQRVRSFTIEHLRACVGYHYRVQAVATDGSVRWITAEHPLTPTSMTQTTSTMESQNMVMGESSTALPSDYRGVLNGTQGQKVLAMERSQNTTQIMQKDTNYNYLQQSEQAMLQKTARIQNCASNGRAYVNVNNPNGVTIDRVHIFYGNAHRYQHAVRNLSPEARQVTIDHLNTCATYYYRVAVVGTDGHVYWQGEQMLHQVQP